MSWTALVPIKSVHARKSRLAPHLSAAERARLSQAMLDHVVGRLRDCAPVGQVLLLSPAPVGSYDRIRDEGRGLNEELACAQCATGTGKLLVIHADLPLLAAGDLDALLEAATRAGQALSPDRHLTGTNAVAIADGATLRWCFGADSFRRHRDVLRPGHAVVRRPGLLLDCDTGSDLTIAEDGGFRWRDAVLPPRTS